MWPSQVTGVSPSDHFSKKQAEVCIDRQRGKANIKPKANQGGRKS